MKGLICWWEGFAGTWLDPHVWSLRLSGVAVSFSGHIHDLDHRTFRIVGDREYEYTPCARCGLVMETGWRALP